jgi:hypothetical protein
MSAIIHLESVIIQFVYKNHNYQGKFASCLEVTHDILTLRKNTYWSSTHCENFEDKLVRVIYNTCVCTSKKTLRTSSEKQTR